MTTRNSGTDTNIRQFRKWHAGDIIIQVDATAPVYRQPAMVGSYDVAPNKQVVLSRLR